MKTVTGLIKYSLNPKIVRGISKQRKTYRVEERELYTHGDNNLTIPAMAYYINSLDIQSSGRGRGGPTYFKVGDILYKICTSHYANFRKKSHQIRPVEWLKLCLDFFM